MFAAFSSLRIKEKTDVLNLLVRDYSQIKFLEVLVVMRDILKYLIAAYPQFRLEYFRYLRCG